MELKNSQIMVFLLLASLAPAFAIDFHDCDELNTNGATYILGASVKATGSCINVTARDVTLQCKDGVIITGKNITGTYGIDVRGDGFTLGGCTIANFTAAVYVNGTAYPNVETVTLTEQGTKLRLNSTKMAAVWIESVPIIHISKGTAYAEGSAFGIRQTGRTATTLEIQDIAAISTTTNAVQIDAATGASVTDGTFQADTVQSFYCASCNASTFNANSFKSVAKGTAFYLSGSNNQITGNTANGSASTGMQLIANGGTPANSNTVGYNNIQGKSAGLNINTAHYNTIIGDTFFCADASTTAITVATAKFNNITGIILNRPNGCANGITLSTASNDTLIRNNSLYVNSSGAAILLSSVTATTFRNTIDNNTLTQGNSTLQNSFVIQISTANPANTSITWNRMRSYSGTFLRTAETGAKLTDFSRNNMTGNPPLWINNTLGVSANFSFNIYPNTSLYDAFDTGGDGYADVGTEIPFNNATLATLWPGQGHDDNPGICRPITPTGINWTSPELNNSANTSRYMPFAWNYTPAGNWGAYYCILSVNGANHTMSQNSSVGGCTHLWDGEIDGYGQFNITGYVIRHSNSLNTTNSTLEFNYTLNEPLRPTNCTWLMPFPPDNTTNASQTFQWQCNMNGTNISACYLQVQNSSGYYNVTGSAITATRTNCNLNAFCDAGETTITCPEDCNNNTCVPGPAGTCEYNPSTGTGDESCTSCPDDCGACIGSDMLGEPCTDYGEESTSCASYTMTCPGTCQEQYCTPDCTLNYTSPFCEANYARIPACIFDFMINATGFTLNNNSIAPYTETNPFAYLQNCELTPQSYGFYPTPNIYQNSTATCQLITSSSGVATLNISIFYTNGTYINNTVIAGVQHNTNATWSYNFSNIPVGSTITVLCNYTEWNLYAYSIPQRVRPVSFGITEPLALEGGASMVLILLAGIMAYLSVNAKGITWRAAWQMLCLLLILGFFGTLLYFSELDGATGLKGVATSLLIAIAGILTLYIGLFSFELIRQVILNGKKRNTA